MHCLKTKFHSEGKAFFRTAVQRASEEFNLKMFQGQFLKIIHKLKAYNLAMDHNEKIPSFGWF